MTIALAYAMDGEIESLLRTADARLLETVCGVPIYEIEAGILAYAGGVGKVIDRCRPDWIVNAGVAGSFLDVPIGTVVLAESFVQHDVDTSAIGDPVGYVSTVGRVEFPTHSPARAGAILDQLGAAHITGKVATGEVFMTRGERADFVRRTFAPALCEMEGGAIAQVCLRNGVKFTALKSVSDRLTRADNAAEYFNFAEAMEKLNRIVLPFARALRDGI